MTVTDTAVVEAIATGMIATIIVIVETPAETTAAAGSLTHPNLLPQPQSNPTLFTTMTSIEIVRRILFSFLFSLSKEAI